jgi:alanine dehydrogenase
MIIGVPKETKKEEYRVALTPAGVAELKKAGHTVLIEEKAGEGSGFSDEDYLVADADIVDKDTLFGKSDLVLKVKEPIQAEYAFFRDGQILFTFLHLAPNHELAEFLLREGITGLAYETLEKDGTLPLLIPMSEIAGRIATLAGAFYLQKAYNGTGVLPCGATGVKPAKAVILGAGAVGSNAARVAAGIGIETVILNHGMERLKKIDEMFMGKVKTLPLTNHQIKEELKDADLVIGAVLVPGGRTPILVTKEMLGIMKPGAVIVDVSIDQGGCFETSRPTTHDDPVYIVDGIIHYCVSNMPGAYPKTSTLALTNATLPYIKELANRGIENVIQESEVLKSALNTYKGQITNKALADALGNLK